MKKPEHQATVSTTSFTNPHLRHEPDGSVWFDRDGAATLRVHPAAALFGALPDRELEDLAADIAIHGLRKNVDIWKATGEVLDGVNRLVACRMAGVAPTFVEVETDDPIAFVISVNERRRHMSVSARAVIADQLAQLGDGQRSNPGAQNCAPAVTQQKAAELMKVSRRSVQNARTVRLLAEPEVKSAVTAGVVSVDVGAAVAKLPPKEQKAAAAEGKTGLKKAATRRRESANKQEPAMTIDVSVVSSGGAVLAHLLETAARVYLDPSSRPKERRTALEELADALFEEIYGRSMQALLPKREKGSAI